MSERIAVGQVWRLAVDGKTRLRVIEVAAGLIGLARENEPVGCALWWDWELRAAADLVEAGDPDGPLVSLEQSRKRALAQYLRNRAGEWRPPQRHPAPRILRLAPLWPHEGW